MQTRYNVAWLSVPENDFSRNADPEYLLLVCFHVWSILNRLWVVVISETCKFQCIAWLYASSNVEDRKWHYQSTERPRFPNKVQGLHCFQPKHLKVINGFPSSHSGGYRNSAARGPWDRKQRNRSIYWPVSIYTGRGRPVKVLHPWSTRRDDF